MHTRRSSPLLRPLPPHLHRRARLIALALVPIAALALRAGWLAWQPRPGELAAAVAILAAAVAVLWSGALGGRLVAALRALERGAGSLGRGERGARAHGGAAPAPTVPAHDAAEDRLVASRLRFEEVLDATPAGILVLDPERLVVRFANHGSLRLLGEPFRGGNVAGRRLEELLPDASELGVLEALRGVAATGEPREGAELRVDGLARGTAWLRWSARTVHAEHGPADLLLVLTDETEQVKARERIETERRRLETVLRTLPVGVFVADAGGQLSSVNDEARRIWGGDAPLRSAPGVREYRGRDGETGVALGHGDWPLERALRGEASAGVELEIDRLDGTTGAILASAAPILDAAGRICGAVSALLDVTELRRATRQREEALHVVSHDLRTPLATVLLGAAGIAALPEGPGAVTRARATARRIVLAGRRMARLADDLVDLAALEEGRLAMRRAPCHPVDLLSEAADRAREAAEEKGLDLCLVAEPGLPHVDCDHDRILQVLGTVIADAVRASDSGAVCLAAEARCGEVVFRVRDNGPGIPAEALAHVFDRLGGEARSLDPGGLGLAVARGIVEAHGGVIRADSAPGDGAVVSFTLPASASAGDLSSAGEVRAGAA